MGYKQNQNQTKNGSIGDKVGQPRSSPRELNTLLGVRDEYAPDTPVFSHRRIKAGQHLVRAGQAFNELYVVNGGFLKSVLTDDCGNEQVISFPMKGDLIGTDGIGDQVHVNDVIALSDADVVIVPFKRLDLLSKLHPGLDASLFRIISQQLIEEQFALIAIGALCVESRLARFLLKYGKRMAGQGYSGRQFNLRMSRQDMGNYLGMKIETVSRTLTAMAGKGLIRVKQREITIVNADKLEILARTGVVKNADHTDRESSGQKSPATGAAKRSIPPAPATPWSMLIGASAAVPAIT